MSNQLSTVGTLKSLISNDEVKARMSEVLGKNAASFSASLIQIVSQNKMLSTADQTTVLSAAMMAATLKLPINNNLGFAYIIPFKNTKEKKTEAQFQLGYKGFIQLAMRTGEFKNIAVTEVHEGQLTTENPLTGYEFDWSIKPKDGAKPVGYVAYFRLLNGFEATNYMTFDQIQSHAKKYSQSFKSNYGPWKDNFDAMASKTVLKLLLSKFAPLSIEINKAIESDQAVIRDEKAIYNDNITIDSTESIEMITSAQVKEINDMLIATASDKKQLLEYIEAESVDGMTTKQYQLAVSALANRPLATTSDGEDIPL